MKRNNDVAKLWLYGLTFVGLTLCGWLFGESLGGAVCGTASAFLIVLLLDLYEKGAR
jgi:hypothetical protein